MADAQPLHHLPGRRRKLLRLGRGDKLLRRIEIFRPVVAVKPPVKSAAEIEVSADFRKFVHLGFEALLPKLFAPIAVIRLDVIGRRAKGRAIMVFPVGKRL